MFIGNSFSTSGKIKTDHDPLISTALARMLIKKPLVVDQPNQKFLHRLSTSTSALLRNKNSQWVEYGAIDDSIIEKLKDDEDVRVRLQVSIISHDWMIRHQMVL